LFLDALRNFPLIYTLSQKDLLNQVINDLQKGYAGIHSDLLRSYALNLRKTIGEALDSPNFENAYFELQQQLISNVTKFAAYKAWHATQQLDRARADEDGVVRSDEEFRRRAQAILNAFNRYQVAEYNTATARARTAKQWFDFSDKKHKLLFPNLRWVPSRSADPREQHMAFYGLVLPKDHSFWRHNQPGNLWNCKCDWEETDDDTSSDIPQTDINAKGLDDNPAITGEIFTQSAPYFRLAQNRVNDVSNALLNLKEDAFFSQKIAGTSVDVHVLHNHGEVAGNIETLAAFLKDRNDVERVKLLPIISPENIDQRQNFYPDKKFPRGKYQNADAIIEFKSGEQWIVDFKAMQGTGGKLRDRLKESYDQADYAVVKIKGTPDIADNQKMANHFMKQHTHFKEIFIYDNAENLIYHVANVTKK
jgi:hypothetical protein